MSEIAFRRHTAGVIAVLEAVGLLVGRAEAPKGGGYQPDGKTFNKYVVVYPIPGGSRSGVLDDPHGDAELPYQVTCVGQSEEQAEWLADKVDVALLTGVAVENRNVHVVPQSNPGARRDDNADPPIWASTPRYRLMTTPA